MMECYAIKDVKGGYFISPFFVRSEAQAIRNIQMALKDPQSSLSQFPGDYELWHISQFDDVTGDMDVVFSHVVNLVTLISKEVENGKAD